MDKNLMVIDGNSLLHRAFYALPLLTNRKGCYTNAVLGFTNMLLKLINDYNPYGIAVAFDRKAPTFRHLAYKAYKATRQKAPEELLPQFDMARRLLEQLQIDIYELDGYEADDMLGTIARLTVDSDMHTLLVTGDRDALQLVSDNTHVLITHKGISEIHRFDKIELLKEYGLNPDQLIDMKGLMGDNSDNIPGVPGIGQKTALKLLKEYGSLEAVLDNIDHISGKKMKENLQTYREQAVMSKELATIKLDVPIELLLHNEPYTFPCTQELKDYLLELEFHSVISKLHLTEVQASVVEITEKRKVEKNYIEIYSIEELVHLVVSSKGKESVAFLLGSDLTISFEQNIVYRVSFNEDMLGNGVDYLEALHALKGLFEDDAIGKITHDAKKIIIELHRHDIILNNLLFDSYIGAYLLEPTRSKYELEVLLYDYTKINVMHADAADLFSLQDIIMERLESLGMYSLYTELEQPLIEVLADMEITGFPVDKKMLQELNSTFSKEVDRLTMEITDIVGEHFNLNSPRQLGEILFEKLRLPATKKTKTGYSTDIEVLEQLRHQHPVVEKIIDYRQVMKLKSTYVDGLLHMISREGRVHSSFNQAVTATGRISSTEPNLQNIPVRLEMGRKIRQVFVPSHYDYLLVDADYSQIELRVLAHISNDPTMIEAFKMNQDIHLRTASEILGIPMEEVTYEQRNSAKAVNFGIVYGISDFGLSRNLGISKAQAKFYIDSYLARYPKVKEYMDNIIAEGKEHGYVMTLLHRRRELPELQSRNFNIRSFGERVALNTPIQGTAADIIKKAMINVYHALKNRNLRSKLILQVHDELLVDTYKPELEEVKSLLKQQMEGAMSLTVPLIVEIGVGKTWYDAK